MRVPEMMFIDCLIARALLSLQGTELTLSAQQCCVTDVQLHRRRALLEITLTEHSSVPVREWLARHMLSGIIKQSLF